MLIAFKIICKTVLYIGIIKNNSLKAAERERFK